MSKMPAPTKESRKQVEGIMVLAAAPTALLVLL
jgi:hypothetical protein